MPLKQNKTKRNQRWKNSVNFRHNQNEWWSQTTDEKTAIDVVQTASVVAVNLGKTGLLLLSLLNLGSGLGWAPGQLLPATFQSAHTAAESAPLPTCVFPRAAGAAKPVLFSIPLVV